jgi:hypothetical protein
VQRSDYNYAQNPEYDFNMTTAPGRLMLHPDVAVRASEVVKKGSVCGPRIQLAKNMARPEKRGRRHPDSLPPSRSTAAIIFADLKNPNRRVSVPSATAGATMRSSKRLG